MVSAKCGFFTAGQINARVMGSRCIRSNGVFLKMQYARVRMNASTTYEGILTGARRR